MPMRGGVDISMALGLLLVFWYQLYSWWVREMAWVKELVVSVCIALRVRKGLLNYIQMGSRSLVV